MNGEDGVRATVADMHRGDIVCAHAGLPETMNDAPDAARAFARPLDAASDTGAGPLRGVDDAS